MIATDSTEPCAPLPFRPPGCPCPQQVKAKVNVGFWGGITPANAHKHDVLWGMLRAGALGFKSFVSPSGINDFENVSRSDVADAMHFLLSKGAPYFVHAELVTDVEQAEVGWRVHAGWVHAGRVHAGWGVESGHRWGGRLRGAVTCMHVSVWWHSQLEHAASVSFLCTGAPPTPQLAVLCSTWRAGYPGPLP